MAEEYPPSADLAPDPEDLISDAADPQDVAADTADPQDTDSADEPTDKPA